MTTFVEDPFTPPPPAKRLKGVHKSWKSYLTEDRKISGNFFGLQELFASVDTARVKKQKTSTNNGGSSASTASKTTATASALVQGAYSVSSNPYTLRLEHRLGGPMAKFRGEERLLLFRSDRAGAIAKIIYSSTPGNSSTVPSLQMMVPSSQPGHSGGDGSEAKPPPSIPPPVLSAAHAKIHVLDVKEQYRGRDLGGLLFSEAITVLKSKYCYDDDEEIDGQGQGGDNCVYIDGGGRRKQACSVECELDAEEDESRYGKLVEFYSNMGCRIKPTARIQYLNNNDGEIYRKVPMQIDLLAPPTTDFPFKMERHVRERRKKFSHLISWSSKGSFLPVQLVGQSGMRVSLSAPVAVGSPELREKKNRKEKKLDLLATQTDSGIQFRTTHGHLLLASPNGSLVILSPGMDNEGSIDLDLDIASSELDKWTHFVLCHVLDRDEDAEDDIASSSSVREFSEKKDLWMLRTSHGTFLSADSFNQSSLLCSKNPSFWQANSNTFGLMCTSDTPPRRHHYRKSWKFQTVAYVESMRDRFLSFSLGRASLRDSLMWIRAFPAYPFQVESFDGGTSQSWLSHQDASGFKCPSLRTICFRMAEAARKQEQPDWFQLVALCHELGEAVKIMDPHRTGEVAESVYDWTISCRSRVVGCKAPPRATFREFRHLNLEEDDSRYNTPTGQYEANCGLDNVLLTWSGPEYIYYLLKHNGSSLPEEGLAIIRYFSLGDWHEHNEYSVLANDEDSDVLMFVSEFDSLRRRVKEDYADSSDLSDEQCSALWDNYYSTIAAKYNCNHVLSW